MSLPQPAGTANVACTPQQLPKENEDTIVGSLSKAIGILSPLEGAVEQLVEARNVAHRMNCTMVGLSGFQIQLKHIRCLAGMCNGEAMSCFATPSWHRA